MRENLVKKKLRGGEVSVGVWVGTGHPDIAEMLGGMGFDWMLFDMEHAPLSFETVQMMMQGLNGSETLPMVRVSWNDIVLIKRALDIGAYGVVIPWVNTKKEAESAVSSCRYPKSGGLRGCGPRRCSKYGLDVEYVDRADREILIVAQIETEEAVRNIEDILSVDGIDVCFVGPADLSMSLGVYGKFDHPRFKDAIQRILDAAKASGVIPGFYTSSNNINERIAQGFRFVNLGSDKGLLIQGCRDAFEVLRAG